MIYIVFKDLDLFDLITLYSRIIRFNFSEIGLLDHFLDLTQGYFLHMGHISLEL